MKKVLILLLGLFVAGLAAYAVPEEIKVKPIDKVIKVFVISENESVSIDAVTVILDADVGIVRTDRVAIDDSNDNQTSPALHSEILRLCISWQYIKNDHIMQNQDKPMHYFSEIRHPINSHRNL